MKFQKW